MEPPRTYVPLTGRSPHTRYAGRRLAERVRGAGGLRGKSVRDGPPPPGRGGGGRGAGAGRHRRGGARRGRREGRSGTGRRHAGSGSPPSARASSWRRPPTRGRGAGDAPPDRRRGRACRGAVLRAPAGSAGAPDEGGGRRGPRLFPRTGSGPRTGGRSAAVGLSARAVRETGRALRAGRTPRESRFPRPGRPRRPPPRRTASRPPRQGSRLLVPGDGCGRARIRASDPTAAARTAGTAPAAGPAAASAASCATGRGRGVFRRLDFGLDGSSRNRVGRHDSVVGPPGRGGTAPRRHRDHPEPGDRGAGGRRGERAPVARGEHGGQGQGRASAAVRDRPRTLRQVPRPELREARHLLHRVREVRTVRERRPAHLRERDRPVRRRAGRRADPGPPRHLDRRRVPPRRPGRGPAARAGPPAGIPGPPTRRHRPGSARAAAAGGPERAARRRWLGNDLSIRLHRPPLPEYPSLIVGRGSARGSGRRCAGGLGRAGAAPW